VLEFDPGRFTVIGTQLGDWFEGTDLVVAMRQPTPGQVIFAAASSFAGTGHLPWGTTGNLMTMTVAIAADAAPGPSAFNLLATLRTGRTGVYSADLQELVLAPPPTNEPDDAVDGILTVEAERWSPDRFFRDLGTQWQAFDDLLSDLVDEFV
jgi:hypothetical protein